MKAFICDSDLRKDTICRECTKRLQEGKLTAREIEVSRILHKLDRKFFFEEFELNGIIELDDIIIIVCTGSLGSVIGKRGRTIAELSKGLGKKCRVVEKTKDEKKMIQDLIGEVRIIGINKAFNPGKTDLVILVDGEDKEKIVSSKDNLEAGLERILGTKARIEFTFQAPK